MVHRSLCVFGVALIALAVGCTASHDAAPAARGPASRAAAAPPVPLPQSVPSKPAPALAPAPARADRATGVALTVERVAQVIPSRILVDTVLTNTSEIPQRLPRRFHVPADIQIVLVRHVMGGADAVVLDGAPAVPEALDAAKPFTPEDFDMVAPGRSARRTLFVNGMVAGGLTPGSYVLTVSWCCVAANVPAGLGDPPPVTGWLTAEPFAFEVRPPRAPPPGQ